MWVYILDKVLGVTSASYILICNEINNNSVIDTENQLFINNIRYSNKFH